MTAAPCVRTPGACQRAHEDASGALPRALRPREHGLPPGAPGQHVRGQKHDKDGSGALPHPRRPCRSAGSGVHPRATSAMRPRRPGSLSASSWCSPRSCTPTTGDDPRVAPGADFLRPRDARVAAGAGLFRVPRPVPMEDLKHRAAALARERAVPELVPMPRTRRAARDRAGRRRRLCCAHPRFVGGCFRRGADPGAQNALLRPPVGEVTDRTLHLAGDGRHRLLKLVRVVEELCEGVGAPPDVVPDSAHMLALARATARPLKANVTVFMLPAPSCAAWIGPCP